MKLEAETHSVVVSFDGAPAKLLARVFVKDGKVVGVRSMRLLHPSGSPVDQYLDGRIEYPDEGEP